MNVLNLKSYFKEHPFVFVLSYLFIHFSLFFLLEAIVNPETATVIHCKIDDYIPFCEYFVIPYLLWFFYVPAIVLFLMKHDIPSFWRLTVSMFAGNLFCLLLYAVFPNTVLPKESVVDSNIFCQIVNFVYSNDTPTNVCPSLHVLDTLAAHIAFTKSKCLSNKFLLKALSFVFAVLVCISTVTLKQHSIIDVIAAFALMFLLYLIFYKKYAQKFVS